MEKELEEKLVKLEDRIFTEAGVVSKLPDLSIPPSKELISKWIENQHRVPSLINGNENISVKNIKNVAGLDITYEPTNQKDKTHRMFNGMAAITVHDYESRNLVACFVMRFKTSVPYEKGLLSLREVPIFVEMLSQIKSAKPDLLIVDGFGQWHETMAGSATMLSLHTGIPAIGIAKDFLEVKDVTMSKEEFKALRNKNARNKDDMIVVPRKDNGKLMGMVLNTSGAMQTGTDIVSNTAFVYISVGDGIGLVDAVLVVKHLSIHKTCEPIRSSDFAASYFFNK